MNPISRRNFMAVSACGALQAVCGKNIMPESDTTPSAATGIVFDDRFTAHGLEPGHPETPARLPAMRRHLTDAGLWQDLVQIGAVDNIDTHLARIHTGDHVASVKKVSTTGDVALLAAAGGCGAVQAVYDGRVRNAFCALRPPGHHAHDNGGDYDGPGQGEGFCFFNNIAVAARYAQDVCSCRKILIIDWDFHHGNGTEHFFYEDASVLFFSTHQQFAYPGTGDPSRTGAGAGKGYNINVHLPCGAGDAEIIKAWEEKLLPAAASFKPDFILVSAGFDSREEDPLGCLAITDDGFAELTRTAMEMADMYCGGRLVSFLEGGYNVEGQAKAVTEHISALMGK